jgi:hypothetical protein
MGYRFKKEAVVRLRGGHLLTVIIIALHGDAPVIDRVSVYATLCALLLDLKFTKVIYARLCSFS